MRSRTARAPTRAMSQASSAAPCRSSRPSSLRCRPRPVPFAAHACTHSAAAARSPTAGPSCAWPAEKLSRRPNEGALGGVPSPGGAGCDVRAADPAVDAEQLDAVGFAAECLLAGCRQPQLQSCERLAVAERRRREKRCAVLALEEPRRSLPECVERPVEPGVAHEGRLLEPLCCDEGGGRCARTGSDRLERTSLRPREAVGRGRQLLEQPAQRGSEERQVLILARRPLAQCRRLGGL